VIVTEFLVINLAHAIHFSNGKGSVTVLLTADAAACGNDGGDAAG
jgi:hypothetical protein